MSISLWVYSPDPPLRRRVIESTCTDGRLAPALRWELAFLTEAGAPATASDGVVTTGQLIGWRPAAPEAAQVRAAIDAGDRVALDDLYSREACASLYMTVMSRNDDRWADIINEELPAIPERFRGQAEHAATWYSFETSARRNDLSLTFQYELWRIVGVLANGLMEDPQEGHFVSIPDNGEEMYVTTPVSDDHASPPARRTSKLLTAAVVLLIGIEIAVGLFGAAQFGGTLLLSYGIRITILAGLWYFAKGGDMVAYWGLVAVAFGYPAMFAWGVLTRPPATLTAWTIAQGVRSIGFIIGGSVLLMPATRRAIARSRDEFELL